MNRLKASFLAAKHWQIFFLAFGAYFAAGALALDSPSGIPFVAEALMVLFVLSFAGWLLSIGSFLFSIAEPTLRLNIRFFRFATIFAGVYLPPALAFPGSHKPIVEALVFFPLFLFALFCWGYAYYFVSKSLVSVERGRSVTRREYKPTLSMLTAAFIGVWELQPRINRLYAASQNQVRHGSSIGESATD